MALEKILTDGSETGQTSADKINLGFTQTDENTEALGGSVIITEAVTKTVGVGKDFETLHLALRWVEIVTQQEGAITLSLDDGTHILGGEGEFDEDEWVYYNLERKSIIFTSASNNSANCLVTLDSFDDGDNYPAIFGVSDSFMFMGAVTFDGGLGGYPYPKNVDFAYVTRSYLTSNLFIMKTLSGVSSSVNSTIYPRASTFDDLGWTGVRAERGGKVILRDVTIQNCDVGLQAQTGGIITTELATTFTNNTEDTNIPLNEIQYDGSYISDGTAPLQTKGLEVITEYTTKTVGVGKDFETLHLALRWVESVSGSVKISLVLDDGIHLLGGVGEFNEDEWTYYYFGNKNLDIESASGNSANCTITLDGSSDFDYASLFYFVRSTFKIGAITLDGSLDGYVHADSLYLFASWYSSTLTISQTVVKNAYIGYDINYNSYMDNYQGLIDNVAYPLNIQSSRAVLYNMTVSNSLEEAIYVGNVSQCTAESMTFTNNARDTNIPLNEIQFDGTYISDGISPLQQKGLEVITEYTTKTVGTGKDFELFDDAMKWYASITKTANGQVNFALDAGVHYIGDLNEYNDFGWSKYNIDGSLWIYGTGQDCIITYPNQDDGDNGFDIFSVKNDGFLLLTDVLVDITYGGYPYSDGPTVIGVYGGIGKARDAVIKNAYNGIYAENSGYGDLLRCEVIGNGGNYAKGISSIASSSVTLNTTSFSNLRRGLAANTSGKISGIGLTFTNNTEDTTIPLNEIQYDGSYISDGTSPLQQKGLEVITESVTKTVGVGKDFETFQDAVNWLDGITITSNGWVSFILDDGIHYIEYDISRENIYYAQWALVNWGGTGGISFEGSDKANCTITIKSTPEADLALPDNWYSAIAFSVTRMSSFYNVTVDPHLDGIPHTYGYIADIYMTGSAFVRFRNTDIVNTTVTSTNARLDLHTTIAKNTPIHILDGGILTAFQPSTIQDNTTEFGLHVSKLGRADASQTTFTNNTTDTNIPLNEIQYDGSYISDGTSPLQQKGLEVITEAVTKTVGVGKDFELFHDAMKWVETVSTTRLGSVRLLLDDGVHYIGEPNTFDEDLWAYYAFSCELSIQSASGDKDLCTITMPSTDDSENYPYMFISETHVSFFQLTIDPNVGGYLYPNTVSIIVAEQYSRFYDVIIQHTDNAVWSAQQVNMNFLVTTFDDCAKAISAKDGGQILADTDGYPLEIKNCGTGIEVGGTTGASLINSVFTNNTEDTTIPLNEIQYDGSYISDGTAPLTLKDSVVGIEAIYEYSRVLDVLDISDTVYSDLGSLVVPERGDATYDIYFSATGSYDNTTNSVLIEFSVTGGATWNVYTHENKDTTDTIMFNYPFPYPVAAGAGPFTLMMRAKKENTQGQFDIHYANIVCKQVG